VRLARPTNRIDRLIATQAAVRTAASVMRACFALHLPTATNGIWRGRPVFHDFGEMREAC
jgi:hypothetical protein